MSESVKVFCMVEVHGVSDPKQAVGEVKEALEGDRVIVFHTSSGRESVGTAANQTLQGLARELGRRLIIRMTPDFFPYMEDYPAVDGQPDLSIRVSEIVGIYNSEMRQ